MDTWSVGCTAWHVLRGKPWAGGDEGQLTQRFVQYFGGTALAHVFQHQPLFSVKHHTEEKTKCFWEDSKLSMSAQRALEAAFVLEPAQRPTCLEISRSPWLEERQTLRVAHEFQAFYGQVVIAEACLDVARAPSAREKVEDNEHTVLLALHGARYFHQTLHRVHRLEK